MEVDDDATEEETLLRYVTQFLFNLDKAAGCEDRDHINQFNRFETVLCVGRNAVRLRLVSYIFSQQIALTRHDDIHLLRKGHFPDLLHPESAFRLMPTLKDAHYMAFLKIAYLTDSHEAFMKHLLSLNNTSTEIVPGALIIDDLTNWIHTNPPVPPISPANPYEETEIVDIDVDEQLPADQPEPQYRQDLLYNLIRLCCFLVETTNFCGCKLSKLKKPNIPLISKKGLLIVTLDLNHLFDQLFADSPPGDASQRETLEEDIILRIKNRSFRHFIDVDQL